MMSPVACPNGHPSGTVDYCDTCGAKLSRVDNGDAVESPTEPSQVDEDEPCPRCSTPRIGDDAFCENCGHEFGASSSHEEHCEDVAWELVITADPVYYARNVSHDVEFPAVAVSRVVRLTEPEIQIGRRSESSGLHPQIDCSIPPVDPAISHLHAVLLRNDRGTYALCDLGSTNGTTINDEAEPIATNTLVDLHAGDRIHIGAWTTLTIRTTGC